MAKYFRADGEFFEDRMLKMATTALLSQGFPPKDLEARASLRPQNRPLLIAWDCRRRVSIFSTDFQRYAVVQLCGRFCQQI